MCEGGEVVGQGDGEGHVECDWQDLKQEFNIDPWIHSVDTFKSLYTGYLVPFAQEATGVITDLKFVL